MLMRYLKSKGYQNIKSTNMYIIAEGELPVCLCAHMDTVFPKPPATFYFDREQSVLWSPDGLGADDRTGVYIIINLIEKGYKPSVIFTDLEERGGIGADALIKHFQECPFSDCRALIQLDRRGSNDAVYYECDNKDFEKLITSYGFVTEWGTFTDISVFGPQWGIAAVNLSVGYYNEHQNIETLNMAECHQTIDRVEKMLQDCGNWLSYAYIPVVYNNLNFVYGSVTDCDDIEPWWVQNSCFCCGKSLKMDEGRVIGGATGRPEEDFLVCDECYHKYIDDTYIKERAEVEFPQDG